MTSQLYLAGMADFPRRETVVLVGFLALAVLGVVLVGGSGPLPLWAGALLGGGATAALVAFVGTTLRAMVRQDDEGVESQVAARASMVTAPVVVVAGMGCSLLEGFVGAPRLTAAWASVLAGSVWVMSWTWLSRHFE